MDIVYKSGTSVKFCLQLKPGLSPDFFHRVHGSSSYAIGLISWADTEGSPLSSLKTVTASKNSQSLGALCECSGFSAGGCGQLEGQADEGDPMTQAIRVTVTASRCDLTSFSSSRSSLVSVRLSHSTNLTKTAVPL